MESPGWKDTEAVGEKYGLGTTDSPRLPFLEWDSLVAGLSSEAPIWTPRVYASFLFRRKIPRSLLGTPL